jgi:MOB kinase activator 1
VGSSSRNKLKSIPDGSKQEQLKKYAEATLGSGNLRHAVTLPEGEDYNEVSILQNQATVNLN